MNPFLYFTFIIFKSIKKDIENIKIIMVMSSYNLFKESFA
jgi:hypothetical protein